MTTSLFLDRRSSCAGLAVVLALMTLILPCQSEASDWVYRRSYFSHWPLDGSTPDHPLPEQRSAYRTAYYRAAPGISVRSAYRINNYVLQNGPRIDRTIYREGYIEFNP